MLHAGRRTAAVELDVAGKNSGREGLSLMRGIVAGEEDAEQDRRR